MVAWSASRRHVAPPVGGGALPDTRYPLVQWLGCAENGFVIEKLQIRNGFHTPTGPSDDRHMGYLSKGKEPHARREEEQPAAQVGPAEDGPVVRLIKVDDLLNNAILMDVKLKLTSEDILKQHWTAKKSIDGLFGPHSFKLVPWRQLKSTKYGVLTYSWGNREKRIWGATWAGMIQALKRKKQLKVEYLWIGAPRPRAPALRPPTLRPPRSGPPAVAQISSASTRTTPRRWRRSGGRTRSTPGRTSTT